MADGKAAALPRTHPNLDDKLQKTFLFEYPGLHEACVSWSRNLRYLLNFMDFPRVVVILKLEDPFLQQELSQLSGNY